jgi:general secretion pathway protein G
MTPEQTRPLTPPAVTVTPSRKGKLIVAGVIVLATLGAFGIARITFDSTLSPLQRQTRAEIRGLEGYFKDFYRITGRFPSQAENFYPLIQVGLLQEIPQDPWGRPYQYRMSESGKGYIMSYGADGLPGGSGDAADLLSGGVWNNATMDAPSQVRQEKP